MEENQKVAFDEFKLYYESTEKVTDRRIAANSWNYSICIGILGAIAAIMNWGLGKPTFLISSIFAIILLSGMAALYCSLWIGQIRDLKELNNAKFTVLNQMAPKISFSNEEHDERMSFCPFEKEWDALKKSEVAQEVKSMKIIALKASNIEYLIPRAFRVLFVIIMLSVPFMTWINYESITKAIGSEIQANSVDKQMLKK